MEENRIRAEQSSEEGAGFDIMDELQQLIGEDIEKYHEYKIKKDQGDDPKPRPSIKPAMKKAKLPAGLVNQYFQLN